MYVVDQCSANVVKNETAYSPPTNGMQKSLKFFIEQIVNKTNNNNYLTLKKIIIEEASSGRKCPISFTPIPLEVTTTSSESSSSERWIDILLFEMTNADKLYSALIKYTNLIRTNAIVIGRGYR